MSSVPSYFRGGITTGSQVKIIYKGELQPETLAGITVLGVTGENPDKIKLKRISYFTSGTVLGTTANTVTIRTYDDAITTFNTTNAQDLSTGELAEGCSINVTFHPSKSKKTNIYTATKITDA